MDEAKCPYCKKPYRDDDGKCAECKSVFPWAVEAKSLREEIKSREVNRGRATFTLIEEVFGQAQGGKPVSVAALKGFAFAWLFPRTMIVIGSIITTLVLSVQTAILLKQTQLLDRQTAAAQVDQVEKLRSRIAANSRVASMLQTFATIRFVAPPYADDVPDNMLLTVLRPKDARPADFPSANGIYLLDLALARTRTAVAHYRGGTPETSAVAALSLSEINCGAVTDQIQIGQRAISRLNGLEVTSVAEPELYAQYMMQALMDIVQSSPQHKVPSDLKTIVGKFLGTLDALEKDIESVFVSAASACLNKAKADARQIELLENATKL